MAKKEKYISHFIIIYIFNIIFNIISLIIKVWSMRIFIWIILMYELNFEQLIQFIGNFRVPKSKLHAKYRSENRLIFIVQIAHSILLLIAQWHAILYQLCSLNLAFNLFFDPISSRTEIYCVYQISIGNIRYSIFNIGFKNSW